jgi:hypothetical protein
METFDPLKNMAILIRINIPSMERGNKANAGLINKDGVTALDSNMLRFQIRERRR